jgi:hypothetical protein
MFNTFPFSFIIMLNKEHIGEYKYYFNIMVPLCRHARGGKLNVSMEAIIFYNPLVGAKVKKIMDMDALYLF